MGEDREKEKKKVKSQIDNRLVMVPFPSCIWLDRLIAMLLSRTSNRHLRHDGDPWCKLWGVSFDVGCL
jgi:hypothetical protein